MPDAKTGTLIGIDFGTRKVGVAVGHRLTGSARPLEPLFYNDQAALDDKLAQVMAQWRPQRVVVGLPLAADGEPTAMSARVREFAARLAERFSDVQVLLHDERLTSHAAASRFADRRQAGRARRRDARRLDSVAAALILESWMADNE